MVARLEVVVVCRDENEAERIVSDIQTRYEKGDTFIEDYLITEE